MSIFSSPYDLTRENSEAGLSSSSTGSAVKQHYAGLSHLISVGSGFVLNLTGILTSCKTSQNLTLKGLFPKNLNYHNLNASKIICKWRRRFIPTKRKGGDVPSGSCRNF